MKAAIIELLQIAQAEPSFPIRTFADKFGLANSLAEGDQSFVPDFSCTDASSRLKA